jgi:4-hydroxy-4-methyl-2-oxoglutarate aldolase
VTDSSEFASFPPATLADILGGSQVMDIGIRPLWPGVPRVAGPAFTVSCPPGDNLMLHGAIYRAGPGSVIVVQAGDLHYAVAGGNVCAVAQRRGIAAFVVDGVVRDVAEARAIGFPVFARGVSPVAGTKSAVAPLEDPVLCGGVTVAAGDVIVADEEGVVVVPADRRDEVSAGARARLAAEAAETMDDWQAAHQTRIERLLAEHGFHD